MCCCKYIVFCCSYVLFSVCSCIDCIGPVTRAYTIYGSTDVLLFYVVCGCTCFPPLKKNGHADCWMLKYQSINQLIVARCSYMIWPLAILPSRLLSWLFLHSTNQLATSSFHPYMDIVQLIDSVLLKCININNNNNYIMIVLA